MDAEAAPALYFDLGSPYAYLAAERVDRVLGREVEFEPVLLGALFRLRGHGSWAQTPPRDAGIAEVERRAARYGLPPLRWPEGWPNNTLQAMRVAVWAKREGLGRKFALAGFRRAFAEGADLSRLDVVGEVAASVGLPAGEVPDVVARTEIKDALRDATDAAYRRGVAGVPCLEAGGAVYYGDDQLERAAADLAAAA